MTHQAFFDALKNGTPARVYLFSGEEEHVKRSALRKLRERILTPGLEQMNETILDNPSADAIISSCETLPMMDACRLIVVRDSALLTAGARGTKRRRQNGLPRTSRACRRPPVWSLLRRHDR